jgi:hypothetical protein
MIRCLFLAVLCVLVGTSEELNFRGLRGATVRLIAFWTFGDLLQLGLIEHPQEIPNVRQVSQS